MKKFIFEILLFILVTTILAFFLDIYVTGCLRRTDYKDYKVWNDIYTGKASSDIIILGSSRAVFHISPQIIEEALGASSYNIGRGGFHFPMSKFIFNEYIKYNKKPKAIIISLDTNYLTKGEKLVDYYQFLPYLSFSNMNFLRTYKGLSLLDYIIPLYRYRLKRELYDVVLGEVLNKKKVGWTFKKGYLGYDAEFNEAEYIKNKKELKKELSIDIDRDVLSEFEMFIQNMKKNNVELIFVYTPEFYDYQKMFSNRKEIFNVYSRLAEKYNILFLDYSSSNFSNNKIFFVDIVHLNKKGSEFFSKKLVNDLQNIF